MAQLPPHAFPPSHCGYRQQSVPEVTSKTPPPLHELSMFHLRPPPSIMPASLQAPSTGCLASWGSPFPQPPATPQLLPSTTHTVPSPQMSAAPRNGLLLVRQSGSAASRPAAVAIARCNCLQHSSRGVTQATAPSLHQDHKSQARRAHTLIEYDLAGDSALNYVSQLAIVPPAVVVPAAFADVQPVLAGRGRCTFNG
jgi:hypothetical protein